MNGHELSGLADGSHDASKTYFIGVKDGATLTVTDNSEVKSGVISSTYKGNSQLLVVDVNDGSKLALQGGTITNGSDVNYGSTCVFLRGTGALEMTGGKIAAVKNPVVSKRNYALTVNATNAGAKISDGTITTTGSNGISATAPLSISGGTFEAGTFPGINYLAEGAKAVWSGITCSVSSTAPTTYAASLTRNGATEYFETVEAAVKKVAVNGDLLNINTQNATVTLSVPRKSTYFLAFSGEGSLNTDSLVTITGALAVTGVIPENFTGFVASAGYALATATENETTTYTAYVPDDNASVQLVKGDDSHTNYLAIMDAINDSVAGDKIKLVKDIDLGTGYASISKNITLDLNGHSITSASTGNFGAVALYTNDILITDSSTSGGGSIKHTAGKYGIYISGSGKTYTIEKVAVEAKNDAAIYINMGTANIKTGSFSGKYGLHLKNDASALATVSGGFFSGSTSAVLKEEQASLTITGGTFSSDPSAYVASGYVVSGSNPWTVQRYVAPPVTPPVTPPAVTVPVSDGENKVDVTAQIEDETAVLDVNLDALGKVVTDESPAGPLVIDLSALKQPVSTVILPADALKAIANAANDEDSPTSGLTVQTAAGAMQLDALTLQTLADTGSGALSLTISPVPADDLTAEQTDLIGDGVVIRLEAHVGSTQVSSFGGGLVTVSIPVVGEPKTGMIVWRVSEKTDGSPLLTPIACTYNAKTNCYEFQTPQFSYYALGQFPFTDVPGGAWFYENVVYAYQNGLIEGIGNNLFAPAITTTRAMLITMLWRLENQPDAPKPDFTDLEKDWYRAAVAWAADVEISLGYGDGRFGPEDVLTRELLVTILYRYAQYKGLDVSKENDLSGFTDKALVADWAMTAMRWAVAAGLVQGNAGKLMPQHGAERAQTAAILQRYLTAQ